MNKQETLELLNGEELTVYYYSTWGSYGQHRKILVFHLSDDNKFQPSWNLEGVRWIDTSSRKNTHKTALIPASNVKGRILRIFKEYQSSSKKTIAVDYCRISDNIENLTKKEIRTKQGFIDVVNIDGKEVWFDKNGVVQQG